MTGQTLLYRSIEENQEAIDYVIQKYFPEVRGEKESSECLNKIYTPIWEHPADNRIKLRPLYPKIPDGCRNISLTSLAGMLHNLGYTKKQIYEELCVCNSQACVPPLDAGEIQAICNSVSRYKR